MPCCDSQEGTKKTQEGLSHKIQKYLQHLIIQCSVEKKDRVGLLCQRTLAQTNLILISMVITTRKIWNAFMLIFNKQESQQYHYSTLKSHSCFSFRKLGVEIVSKNPHSKLFYHLVLQVHTSDTVLCVAAVKIVSNFYCQENSE